MKFIEKNDWGNRSYKIGDQPFTNKNTKIEIKLKPRTSDSWHKFDVDWLRDTERVSDHGKEYPVTSDVPFITINYEGVLLVIELSRFQEKQMRIPS